MSSIPHVARALQHVLSEIPEQLARESAFCRRRSKLTAAVFVQALVLGWLAHPAGSLQRLSRRAATAGVAISPQGLAQRFTPAAAELLRQVWAAAVTEAIVATSPPAAGLLARFPAVVVIDSTTVALPDALAETPEGWTGCGGRAVTGTRAALKLTVRLNLAGGALAVAADAGRTQDKATTLQHAPLPPGALRVADLGFWSLTVLGRTAEEGAFFLSRLHLRTAVFHDAGPSAGERIALETWLVGQTRRRLSVPVRLGVAAQLPARLLAVRVPTRVAEDRRSAIRAEARRKGAAPSPRRLALAAWTLLVTNAPPARLGIADALVLARARWQIELLFKLWKSHGHLDAWRTADPVRIRCELYAKLTALVIQHWALLVGGWDRPERSLTQMAEVVRDHAVAVLAALPTRARLVAALTGLCRDLASGCRVGHRRRAPSLFQLLADPACGGLA